MSEPTEASPLCFVLMPFGVKSDPVGGPPIDFEAVWAKGLEPGIRAAGMEPVRADLEQIGGVIHRAMFERLLLCDFSVADLTTANANVFYELGVRHAAVPATTLPVLAARHRIPFEWRRCAPCRTTWARKVAFVEPVHLCTAPGPD